MIKRKTILSVLLTVLGGGMPVCAVSDWNVRDHVPVSEFMIQSHRGAGEMAPENTLETFELAWDLGTIPEADLRTTKDGVIVAFHDKDFARVVKDLAPRLEGVGIADLAFADLAEIDVGAYRSDRFAGQRIPRMTAVFKAMRERPERQLYLDIKDVDLKRLAEEVREAGVGSQIILATSRHGLIREWKELVPESQTLLWIGGDQERVAKRLAELREEKFAGITQLQIHARPVAEEGDEIFNLEADFIRKTGAELRDRGILFQSLPWGAAEPVYYWRLMDLGVASFATDYPEITLRAVRDYYRQKARR